MLWYPRVVGLRDRTANRTSAASLVTSAHQVKRADAELFRLQTAPDENFAQRRTMRPATLSVRCTERSKVIGRDRNSPVAVSVLSLSLLLPFGAGAFPDRAITVLKDAAAQGPAKHILFANGQVRQAVETRATTVDGFLRERGISLAPGDSVSHDLDAVINDGVTIAYRPAVPVDVVVDGVKRAVRTSAASVGDALIAEHFAPGPHDTVVPNAHSPVEPNSTIRLTRATSWLEHVRSAIAPPVKHKYDVGLSTGTRRIVDPGAPGTKESTVEVLQPNPAVAPRRLLLAARILRFPRAKVVAEGVGDYSALAGVARRGMTGTVRLADAALQMVATAYTPQCTGCSGITASGRPAGHGIVAVDPHYIPLGTRLYIPGYGHALAGDTGGAIRGNRIDLGFESNRDALRFGRRPIVVYVFNK
jgi:3D (Asp-Asp-Asp) domain-containing protein